MMISPGFERSVQTIRAVSEQGWTYPSNYLDIYFDKVSVEENIAWMEVRDHCLSRDGQLAWPAFGVFVDVGLSNAARSALGQQASLATVSLNVSVKRLPGPGKLKSVGRIKNTLDNASIGAVVTEVDIYSENQELLASGRALMGMAPFKNALNVQHLPSAAQEFRPWRDCVPAAGSPDYQIYAVACHAQALDNGQSFIDKFWAMHEVREHSGQKKYRIDKGDHLVNRAGNVHGGVLYGLAANAARAVVPEGWLIAESSVQYLNAASEAYFYAATEVLRKGKNTMVVECVVKTNNDKKVIYSQWIFFRSMEGCS